MQYSYQTEQTCSQQIDFEIKDGKLYNVTFYGGCHGNLQGLSRLVEGMKVEDMLAILGEPERIINTSKLSPVASLRVPSHHHSSWRLLIGQRNPSTVTGSWGVSENSDTCCPGCDWNKW